MASRGRLSTMDLLPEDAAEDVAWAIQQLAERRRTQEDIRFEFNDRLEAKGIEGISRTAFNRRAVKLWEAQRRIAERRALFEGIAPQFTAEDVDDSNIILGEFIKTLISEIVTEDSARSPKNAMELASAYQKTVSAMKVSSDRRAKLQAEMNAKLHKATEAATEAAADGIVAATPGAKKEDVLRRIREDIYGIFET